jgi:hypothetical protein
MGEVECRDRRLPDIGVDVTGHGAKPRLDRIHRLSNAGEIAALYDLLDKPELFTCRASVFIPDCHRGGDIRLTARIFDQHHPVGRLGDLGEQRIDERLVLPVEDPPATSTFRRFSTASRKTIAFSANIIPAAT